MIELIETEIFSGWVSGLRDVAGKAVVLRRIRRLSMGNAGDVRSVGDRVSEPRVDFGPGYRVYFTRKRNVIVILLCGGDKSSRSRDIAKSKAIAKELEP